MIQDLVPLLILDKREGETPLACIERFKKDHPQYAKEKMTYAGRLDPIASGLLIVLVGDAVHHKDRYNQLDKVYTCTALIGVSTDTYDILGIPQMLASGPFPTRQECQQYLDRMKGAHEQAYPPYSSKTINGVPMHTLARQGKLSLETIPTRQVTIKEIIYGEIMLKDQQELKELITTKISQVVGDFRQEVIREAWNQVLVPGKSLALLDITLHVSGGTYIRGIIHELGRQLGQGASILDLKRTKIGSWSNVDIYQ